MNFQVDFSASSVYLPAKSTVNISIFFLMNWSYNISFVQILKYEQQPEEHQTSRNC